MPLNNIITKLNEKLRFVKRMKDPTRGGLATAINEISKSCGFSIELYENKIKVKKETEAVCSLLGMDPLYLACEGRMILVVKGGKGNELAVALKSLPNFEDTKVIGKVLDNNEKTVILNTTIGGRRILNSYEFQTVPRIC